MSATINKPKDVLIIEFNEFNAALLHEAVKLESLPAIEKMLNLKSSHYKTSDRYNSGYLEPWVQWVSIHSGTPSSKHLIKHLGDIPDLKNKQFWEVLGDAGISSGVWGVMNGSRNNHEKVKFFIPDPWTFTEDAHPQELDALLRLPRYVSKNYRNLKKSTLLKYALALFKVIRKNKKTGVFIKEVRSMLKGIKKYGKKQFLYICFFEYMSAHLFCEYKKKFKPQVNILFLNSIAHLQHHLWYQGSEVPTPEILYGLKVLDKAFAMLWESFPDDCFIFHNGLSQMNTNHEKPWILYRQKDPTLFLKSMGLKPTKVEQHMTHDGHVFFADANLRDEALLHLQNATIGDEKLFHVEKNEFDDTKLFYHLIFTNELEDNVAFEFNHKKYRFFTHFDKVVKRTGRHLPLGTVFCNEIPFSDHMFNHDFNRYVYKYLGEDKFPMLNSNFNNENLEPNKIKEDENELCVM
jgi:hypothetical protein